MLLLAFNAAVSNRFTSGAILQFDVVNFRGAAGGTNIILSLSVTFLEVQICGYVTDTLHRGIEITYVL